MRQVRAGSAVGFLMLVALLATACTPETVLPPVLTVPEAPPQPAPQFPVSATPAQVANEIVRWFSSAGYHRFQAEALADHAMIESGFRPCAAGPADLRYTYQWGGTRLQRLYEFASTRSCPPLDWQLAFADTELRNDPKFACFWYAHTRAEALGALRRGFGRGSC
jgi:hypothetical protein